MKGLLVSRMFDTARGLVWNFISLIDLFGFVPNGSRIYYTSRSQPPLFTKILYDYFVATRDVETLKKGLVAAEKEWQFWRENRLRLPLGDNGGGLHGYFSDTGEPRSESYAEDVEAATRFKTERERMEFYNHIAAAAESGWDFSSRWMSPKKSEDQRNERDMADLETTQVIPIDLNCLLFQNEFLIAKFHLYLRCLENDSSCFKALEVDDIDIVQNLLQSMDQSSVPQSAARFLQMALERRRFITDYFWNSTDKRFYDYDLRLKRHRVAKEFGIFISSLYPLWTKAYDPQLIHDDAVVIMVQNLDNLMFSSFPGGVPTSLTFSNQQWDLPNAWPPLQWVIVESLTVFGQRLNESEQRQLKNMAMSVVIRYLKTTFCGHIRSTSHGLQSAQEPISNYNERRKRNLNTNEDVPLGAALFEKYDARFVGRAGNGGEYIVQAGFGWTNGVILDFLHRFSQDGFLVKELARLDEGLCSRSKSTMDSDDDRAGGFGIPWLDMIIMASVTLTSLIFLCVIWFKDWKRKSFDFRAAVLAPLYIEVNNISNESNV